MKQLYICKLTLILLVNTVVSFVISARSLSVVAANMDNLLIGEIKKFKGR